ncbi:MAG: DNA-processing protein DprA [Candidatus Eisenbacteria bacterium]
MTSTPPCPNVRAVHPHDPEYPARLLDLGARRPDPLFTLGSAPWPPGPVATVVGARAETRYARRVTLRIVAGLVAARVTVASGLARGVDASAHRAALARGGFTVAVLGVGIDQVYPPEHASLYTTILDRGRLLSPWEAGEGVRRGRFPARNRVLAALADLVIVTQADAQSGSRHTVRAALELGRAVCVAPWPLGQPQYEGGASWVRAAFPRVRVLTAFDEAARLAWAAYEAKPVHEPAPRESLPERLVALMSGTARDLEALARAADAAVGETAAALLALEIAGRVERVPGDRYRRRLD